MEHTKGKLKANKINDRGEIMIFGCEKKDYVCSVQVEQIGGGEVAHFMENCRRANAEHLVKCWNMHDDLVSVLEDILLGMDNIPERLWMRGNALIEEAEKE